jgi:hypothetical protein
VKGDVEVLYIAGWGRSGSTILDTVLGQADQFTSVGEIKFIWERGLLENRNCGCGQAFRSCPFWTEVMRSAFGDMPERARVLALDQASKGFRTRQLPLLWSGRMAGRYVDRFGSYLDDTLRLYRAILEVANTQVVVDSSKFPSYLAMLGRIPGIRVRTVHLVRDPRAVAHSWTRDKVDPDHPMGEPMPRLHPATTGAYWTAWNSAIERIGRRQHDYMLVRYEDLTASPEPTLRSIVHFSGFTEAVLPFLDGDTVAMEPSHTVSGNPIRHLAGPINIRQDAAWLDEMTPAHQRWASLTSSPLRHRYGY